MSIDLRQFHQTFFEESFEGLDLMEASLLHLDVGAADLDVVNAVFRAAHSIKGGSGTFGFSSVASFTHVLETLLDGLRTGARTVTGDTVDILLMSVDCLREMLAAVKKETAVDQERVDTVQRKLEFLLGQSAPAVTQVSDPSPRESELSGDKTNLQSNRWDIHFKPFPELLRTGNDPMRLFRELESLGELQVTVDSTALPSFSEMDPTRCYFAWTLTLVSEVEIAPVEEVFAWVEGNCVLEICLRDGALTASNNQVDTSVGKACAQPNLKMVPPAEERRTSEDRRKTASGSEAGSIRVAIDKIDALINMVGELVITQSMLTQLGQDFELENLHKLHTGLADLERNTRELQESVMGIRMLPMSFAFNRFPRLVHDLSQKLGKSVELKMTGEHTELDKTVLEKIVDPLVHLVRNSLDHGIESPADRATAGKSPTGTIRLSAAHQGGNVVIEIGDDGAGLNKQRIFAKAVEKGLVQSHQHLSEDEVYRLIFLPGFSTAEVVSDVSGRGVGMDVVSRNIKSLGGTVDVHSIEGAGTRIVIRLPLTLAILDGQSAVTGGNTYIIPLVSIVESIQVGKGMVSLVAGKGEVLALRNEYLPILRLYQIFDLQPRTSVLSEGLIVVVEGDGKKVGLFVEELLGQQQVVIKSLETNFKKVEGISGATILGDGTVALILDIPGLISLARRETHAKPISHDTSAAVAA